MSEQILLKLENITKKFGNITAVNSVSFDIRKGEIHGLIGENGSGKSTVSSIISGLYPCTSGKMLLEGEAYEPTDLICANEKGISIIVQEMSTIEELTVAENIFLGKEKGFSRAGMIRHGQMNQKAQELLAAYGLEHIRADEPVEKYGFEERKLVELVKNTYFHPKLLIVDETTTALSVEGKRELLKSVWRLKEEGTAIIIISHDLNEIIELCDRITVLRDGSFVTTIENEGTTEDELKKYMIGREMEGHYYRNDMETHMDGKEVLKVENVSVKGVLDRISFELHQGEILGIGGLTDSGMHELGKVLFGAMKKDSGRVTVQKSGHEIEKISGAIREGIAYTSKNRDREGLVLNASIRDNISLGNWRLIQKRKLISPKTEYAFAETHAKAMQTKMEHVDQFVSTLSGGNKQKVVLAKWIAQNPDILILDSPTRGIDIKVKSSIYSFMQDLVKEKKAIILISEEILELIGMSDRVLILKNGKISSELLREDTLTEEKIINCMI